MISSTPQPPYFAVIFTSEMSAYNLGYSEMAEQMAELAKQQTGYLGHESAREELGITVSYWDSLEAIQNWKNNLEHLIAQKKGIEEWYAKYKIRISRVERDYGFIK